MCKLCVSAFLLVATLTLADAFFLPVFVRKQEPQTPAVTTNNVGWSRGNQPAQSTYKDYSPYTPHMQPVPMASMQQFSYEPPSMMMSPYHQMRVQPQFHDVQLVPCMCPLTRELIEQQTQGMMQVQSMQQAAAAQPNQDSTKLNNVQNANKAN